MKSSTYIYVNEKDSLEKFIGGYSSSNILAIDTETMGENPLNPRKSEIRLLQIASPNLPVLLVDWMKISENDKKLVKNLLENTSVKVFHNAKFDLKFLTLAGINIETNIFDTYLASGVLSAGLDNQNLKLDAVVNQYLNIYLSKEEQRSNWSIPELSQEQLEYAAKDASTLLPLREKLIDELVKADLIDTAKLEFQSIPAIVQMELNGIHVDTKRIENLRETLTKEKELKVNELKDYFSCDININSPKQLLEALELRGISVSSTSYETLSVIASEYEEVRLILEYKDIDKKLQFANKLSNCIDKTTDRIYSNYLQLGAATGRLSCTDFNLQQVPNVTDFRECFIPNEGNVFVISDYSQMQIRIAAEISKDYEMIEAYQRGEDLHILTASLINGIDKQEVTKEMRTAAKALNFGMLFGMGSKGFVKYAWSNYGVDRLH